MKITLNPDIDLVNNIKDKLLANNGYCPCSTKRLPETKCMCKAFREQEEGECHCGLYIKVK